MGCGLCSNTMQHDLVPINSIVDEKIEIQYNSQQSSDENLKEISKRDIMPLLEGPTLMNFENNQTSSSDIDEEIQRIQAILKEANSNSDTDTDVSDEEFASEEPVIEVQDNVVEH